MADISRLVFGADTGPGTLPKDDDSSVGTDLVAWNNLQILLRKSLDSGKLFQKDIVSTYSLIYTTTNAYYGGVLAANGDIHFIPWSGVRGQKISPSGVVSTYSLVYTGGFLYTGGVLAPNGDRKSVV